MRLGTMLQDITASFFKRPATRRYPFERVEAPVDLRGKLVWNPEKCNGCQLCSKDCPAKALELLVIDKKAKRFVMRFHADRCTYCAQCVQNCRLDCLAMAHQQWELAGLTPDAFVVNYGNEADVQALLAQLGPGCPPAPAAGTAD